MAAGAFTLYDSAHENFWNGTFKFGSDTIKCVLLSDSYTPSTSHEKYSDISSSEISDSDYSPKTVSNTTVSASGDTVTLDCDSVDFGSKVDIEAKYMAFVVQSGGSLSSGDKLIGYADLNDGGGTVSSTQSEFKVSPDSSGLLTSEPK